MRTFNERDIRRHYDLLQHRPELGVTELKAMEGDHLFGVGLFDNEDDFVAECRRYSGLGSLYVGVNPRSKELLDQYGGLKNRMRSLFQDVVASSDIPCIMGVAVAPSERLSESAEHYRSDASRLHDGEWIFPMDRPLEIAAGHHLSAERKLGIWFTGQETSLPLTQFTLVMGTSLPEGNWFRTRTRFRRYRPFILDGIATNVASALGADVKLGPPLDR